MYWWRLGTAVVLGVTLAGLVNCGKGEPKSPLRAELDGVLAAKKQAEQAGDMKAWKATVSSRHYAEAHNGCVSMLEDFDGNQLRTYGGPQKEDAKLRFVKTLENGDTAGLLYVRDQTKEENPPGGKDYKPRVKFTLWRFVREGGCWKCDNGLIVPFDKFGKDGKETEFIFPCPDPDLEINGIVRKAQPLCPKPDYRANMDAFCMGCRIKVLVNGFPALALDDSNRSGVLVGGLRKGRNAVRIEITPKPGSGMQKVEVSIYLPDKAPKYLLSYKPEGKLPPIYEAVIEMPPAPTKAPSGSKTPQKSPSQ